MPKVRIIVKDTPEIMHRFSSLLFKTKSAAKAWLKEAVQSEHVIQKPKLFEFVDVEQPNNILTFQFVTSGKILKPG